MFRLIKGHITLSSPAYSQLIIIREAEAISSGPSEYLPCQRGGAGYCAKLHDKSSCELDMFWSQIPGSVL